MSGWNELLQDYVPKSLSLRNREILILHLAAWVEMSINLKCSVVKIYESRIPDVYLVDMGCGDTSIQMDIHRSINVVREGDSVEVVIDKEVPTYTEGRDFVAHGYVVSKREVDNNVRIYVSLWGYLVIISTGSRAIADFFNYMDKIYIKIGVQSSPKT